MASPWQTGMTSFGVQLHGTFPMGRYPEIAREVERHPFDELTVHDVVWWRPVWPILTLVAANTSHVRIGPDVTHPYLRHPVVTAGNLAAIDELSGGRAILGLGRGSMTGSIGVQAERPLEAVRECAELVQRFLRRERAPFDGTVFRAEASAQLLWEPPRPAVYTFVGAFAPRMVESVAGWADEVRPPGIWACDFFRDLKARAQASAAAAGRKRELRIGCEVWLALDTDREVARALGREIVAQFLPHMKPMTDFYEIEREEIEDVERRLAAGDRAGAAARVSERTLATFVAAGTAREIAAGVARLVDAGASTITFSGRLGRDPVAAVRELGTAVLAEVA